MRASTTVLTAARSSACAVITALLRYQARYTASNAA
jgi:hypothetical protein